MNIYAFHLKTKFRKLNIPTVNNDNGDDTNEYGHAKFGNYVHDQNGDSDPHHNDQNHNRDDDHYNQIGKSFSIDNYDKNDDDYNYDDDNDIDFDDEIFSNSDDFDETLYNNTMKNINKK